MRFIFCIICVFAINIAHAQDNDIKSAILKDVLLFDQVNNNEYIEKVKYVIEFPDSNLTYSADQILSHVERHVQIISIDTFRSLYRIRVKLWLSFKFRQLKNDTFEYVLCENYNKYYRINGFMVSDFFQLEHYQIEALEDSKFIKHKNLLKYYNKAKINNDMPFVIAVPEKLRNKYGLEIFSRPIMSSSVQLYFNAR